MSKEELIQEKMTMGENYYEEGLCNQVSPERITPNNVTNLAENEVFVFGSNICGQHNGGAAGFAVKNFGAVYGQNYGLQGNSFAIPSVGVDYKEMSQYVEQFIEFAKQNSDKKFWVTRVGCGNAGKDLSYIARMFVNARNIENIALPIEFWNFL